MAWYWKNLRKRCHVTAYILTHCLLTSKGRLRGLVRSAAGHRFIVLRFRPWSAHVKSVFHLSARLIASGGRSVHLAYHVHKCDRKPGMSKQICFVSFGRLPGIWTRNDTNRRSGYQKSHEKQFILITNAVSLLKRPFTISYIALLL